MAGKLLWFQDLEGKNAGQLASRGLIPQSETVLPALYIYIIYFIYIYILYIVTIYQ